MSLIHEALERIGGVPVPPNRSSKKRKLKAPVIRLLRWYARIKKGRRKSVLAGLVLVLCLVPVMVFSWIFAGSDSKAAAKPAPYVLTGIVDGKQKQALINNQLLHVGDKIAGAKVYEIQDKSVILKKRSKKIYLSL